MKCLLSLLVLTSVAALAAPAAVADEDASASSSLGDVLARLASEDPASLAWGAYLAGRDGHHEAVAPILDLLRPHVDREEKVWSYTHRSALDALIRLDAFVPPALLALHEARLPVHVLILRAHDPEAHVETLVDRFQKVVNQEHVGHMGLATGNLLLKIRATRFAAQLLSGIRMRLRVTVYTPGPNDRMSGFGGRRMLGGSGDGSARVPEGFPPYVWYQLRRGPASRGALLVGGPHPVFYERRERATSGLAVGGAICRLDTTETCLEWLGALLGEEVVDLGIKKRHSVSVGWTTAEAYLERVRAGQAQLLTAYWAVARRLVEAKLLTLDEARNLKPRVKTNVTDDRTDKTDAIPAVPALAKPAWIDAVLPAK